MSQVQLKEKIMNVYALANAGLKATSTCFINIAFETFKKYTNPEALKKYKSESQAIAAMANSMVRIGEDISNANEARLLIYTLYPESIGQKKEANIPRQVLLLLISLAEKYEALSLVAEQFAAEATTFGNLKEKAMELNYTYGKAKDWATKYPKAYRPLTAGNGVTAIMTLIAILEQQISRLEQQIAVEREEEVTPWTETQVVELPEKERRAG